MTKIEATWKVHNLRTRMTLYTRLNKHNWKLGEIALIEKL